MNFEYLNMFFTFLTGFFVSLSSIPSIIKVARLKSLYDVPDERKAHKHKIPTLGGLAIFAGLIISLTLWGDSYILKDMQYVVAATVVMFFIGIKDDILITAPLTKMLGQIVCAVILILPGNIMITNFQGFFGIFEVDYWIGFVFTLLVILTVVNGFNLIDGIDGLASGLGIFTSLVFGYWFFVNGLYQYVILSLALAGATMGFLRFNLFGRRNKIFMGDTGSLIVGLIISVLAIRFNQYNQDKTLPYTFISAASVTFGILVVPVFDVLRVVFIRAIKNRGRRIFSPDKNHIHHILLKLGLSHRCSTFIILLVNLFFVIFSFAYGDIIPIRRLLLLLVLLAMFIFYIPVFILDRREKFNKNRNL